MNSITERWFRSPRAELTDRTQIWDIPHLLDGATGPQPW